MRLANFVNSVAQNGKSDTDCHLLRARMHARPPKSCIRHRALATWTHQRGCDVVLPWRGEENKGTGSRAMNNCDQPTAPHPESAGLSGGGRYLPQVVARSQCKMMLMPVFQLHRP